MTHSPFQAGRVQKISITNSTLFRIVLIAAIVYFLFFIRDVLFVVFVSWVLSSALDPFVHLMERYKVPRWLTLLMTFVIIIAVVTAVFALLIPALFAQLTDVTVNFSTIYAPRLDALWGSLHISGQSISEQLQNNLATITQNVGKLTSGVFGAVGQFLNGLITALAIMVMAFYMTVEEEGIKKFVRTIAPLKYHPYLVQKLNKVQGQMGAWLRGQLLLTVIVGSLVSFGLWALGVKYALLLGILAGLMEFIPVVGAILSAVIATFFGLTDSPFKGLAVLILCIVVQQLEANLIVPRVMGRAVGMNPLVIIISILIGAKFAGVIGVLLAVPAALILWIILEDFFKEKEALETSLETDDTPVDESVLPKA